MRLGFVNPVEYGMRTVMAALLVGVPACAPSSDRLADLREQIERRIADSDAEVVGIYYRELEGGDSLLVDPDVRLHAASTMKVPVMIQLYRDADAGMLTLDSEIPVTPTFTSIADGSRFLLDPTSDSDSSLYALVGGHAPMRHLIDRMITWSSNLATNILIELADATRVTATMRTLGADSIAVLRGVEDLAAFQAGLSNTTTARDLGVILIALATGSAASEGATREMLEILERQHFNEGIPAGLPPGTRVAHKTGSITAINHDAAIVFPEDGRAYVLVVLLRGIEDHDTSSTVIADISRLVWGARVHSGL
jgi:beta-lactamase class A